MKISLFIAAFLTLGFTSLQAQAPMTLKTDLERGEIEVRFKEQKILVYAFASNQFKPYVRELYTVRGENITRDAPADHLHHHGLMYAIRINGTNFWEETGDAGVQKPIELLAYMSGKSPDGLPQAQFTQLIHWLASANRDARKSESAALLVERRTLTVTVDEPNDEVALRWDSAFQAGRGARKIVLHGSTYNGLGLRLPVTFDKVGVFQNSAGAPYAGRAQSLIPAKWTAVSGAVKGGEAMLAMFDSSRNARSPGIFFSMLDPFAYLSVTQGLEQAPMEYVSGAKFGLSYLVAVYSVKKPREFLEQRYERWEKDRR